ncbi:interleukin-9 receptor isoform X7 [Piliocolobus tephrosceles]|uniref:interleukin-9 receptor isoform X7 n=1 Tax=Piliocolobus tephrosceles TaxID=591936 RepID=UPI000E6B0CE1|nr:interleukin-9 receptor isoform X7 [Piliocolobus tephrosceles]
MPQTSDGTGQMHLESNCCKKRQTLLQRTCHGVSCCGWWCQAACSILGKGWTLESEALRRDMGTWLLACTCVCTCVCLGVSVTGEGRGPRAGNFTCLTNNILRIDCRWSAPELGQGSSPWLLFTRDEGEVPRIEAATPGQGSSPVVLTHALSSNQAPGGTHKCILQGSECTVVLPPEAVLVPSDNFTITFHHCVSGREQVSLVDPEYLPRRHVKLDPPSDLQSNISSGHCILTWSISPALEPMTTLLSYELAFKKQEEAWERAQHRDHIVGVTWLVLEAFELDPGFIHEARLRVQMATLEDDVVEEERYTGQWSEWSQPVCFQAPQRQVFIQGEENLLPERALSSGVLPAPLQCAQWELPDLDGGPQGRCAAEPGLCWPPTRSLGVLHPGGHCTAHLWPSASLEICGPGGGRGGHWDQSSREPELRECAASRVYRVEGTDPCLSATGGLGPHVPHRVSSSRLRGQQQQQQ